MGVPIFPDQSQHARLFEATFRFDWTRPPLHANQRLAWRAISERVRLPALPRIEVLLTWVVKDRRRRDAINLYPLVKALTDGLVDAGVIPDDTPQYVATPEPIIRYDATATPHFLLTIREVTA